MRVEPCSHDIPANKFCEICDVARSTFKGYLYGGGFWHRVMGWPGMRPALACDCHQAVGLYIVLSGPYTAHSLLSGLRTCAALQGHPGAAGGELCRECFP